MFGFLLLASPQICETVLGLTSKVIALLEVPDAVNVHLVDSGFFGALNASWLLVIVFDLITIFMVLSLLLEVAERYMVLAMLTITAPLAFAMGGSQSKTGENPAPVALLASMDRRAEVLLAVIPAEAAVLAAQI
ncbi:MAG: hypothetical protein HFF57_10000 [Lawsonibacter sp.]|nr:hypothetical protein [Lawsonibacter sp.]